MVYEYFEGKANYFMKLLNSFNIAMKLLNILSDNSWPLSGIKYLLFKLNDWLYKIDIGLLAKYLYLLNYQMYGGCEQYRIEK